MSMQSTRKYRKLLKNLSIECDISAFLYEWHKSFAELFLQIGILCGIIKLSNLRFIVSGFTHYHHERFHYEFP